MSDLGKRISKRYEQLKQKRLNWDSHWQEIANYYLPEHDDIYSSKTPGEKKRGSIVDSTGPHSLILLAAAMHSMLTNPSAIWMGLTTGNLEIDNDDEARKWLQDVGFILIDTLNSSNFQQEIHEIYIGTAGFGTGLMQVEEDDDNIIRFETRPIFQAHIAESSKNVIDTVYRKYKWTLRQIIQEFGEKSLPKKYRGTKHNIDDEFEVIHAVEPRSDGEIGALSPKRMPFSSVWTFKCEDHILRESGFRTLPYVVPRWMRVPGETYGRGPAMIALPDVKMVNEIMKTTLRGAQKTVDPPLLLPDEGIVMPFKATPSALNYYRAGSQDKILPLQTDARVDFGFQLIDSVQKRIRQAFFIEQLQLPEGPQKTATEVAQHVTEQLRLLGPVLARQQYELLRPMIRIVYPILQKRKLIPKMPAVLRNIDGLRIEYVSEIARAQRLNDMDTLSRVYSLAQPLYTVDPSILDVMNGDEVLRYIAKSGHLPQQLIRNQSEVKKIRENRARFTQSQMQAQDTAQDAENINKVVPALAKANQLREAS